MASQQALRTELRARIARVRRELRIYDKNSALLVSSAPRRTKARDLHYPYHQDNDFFYLTGSELEEATAVIFGDERKPLLIAPEVSELKLIWEGAGEDAGSVARRMGASLVSTDSPLEEIHSAVKNTRYLFHPNTSGQQGFETARKLFLLSSHRRSSPPIFFGHTDHVLEKLRLKKSTFEVTQISQAISISQRALQAVIPFIQPGMRELELATRLRHAIEEQGSKESFPAIIASGPNAAILHHTPGTRRFQAGEFVTIDFGATYEGYAADITRVFPVGTPPEVHRELYSLLLETQTKIVSKIRPGKTWKSLNELSEELLLKGLRELGILKGPIAKLRKEKAIKKFYPHSLGHSLGLAVHDIGPLRSAGEAKLTPGIVVTVEPGIYSQSKIGRIPPFGMRIEDDVLVTATGARNLSSAIPKILDLQ
ncbi:MAG: aminopeptidase P family protein [Bdellovibrionales bacterium]|nr:aminopeptidase P family protein [Bdellovibrionales bacterium]